MPLISIIVPAYQKEEKIEKCLFSILNQSIKEIEVIVVYLKGTDKTEEIIRSFSDPRIRIIEQTEKTGPGGARNIGIQEATASYIGFVDCDDWIEPDYYEKLYNAAERYNADICFARVKSLNSKGKECTSSFESYKVYRSFYDKYSLCTNGGVFSKLFKSELLRKHSISFPLGVFYEDNPFILKAFYHSETLVTVPDAFYHYDLWDKDDTRKTALEKSVLRVAEMFRDFIEQMPLSEQEQNLVRRKCLQCFAFIHIDDEKVYQKLLSIFPVWPEAVAMRRTYLWKNFKRRLFHVSLHRKQFFFLGLQFQWEKK